MSLKTFAFGCVLFISTTGIAQLISGNFEKYPVFSSCETVAAADSKDCFKQTLIAKIKTEFKIPQDILDTNYKGDMVVLFEVTKDGVFKVINITAVSEALREELKRVFDELPKVKPATYNGRPTYMQFSMPIPVPEGLRSAADSLEVNNKSFGVTPVQDLESEYDAIKTFPFKNREYNSELYIPFSHQTYSRFDKEMNAVGTNAHTAGKPFIYSEVNKYYAFKEKRESLYKDKESWFGRKLWNEHMVTLQGEDYWFTFDPAADLQLGFETADNEGFGRAH